MTTIKATCPDCGEVDLTAEDISAALLFAAERERWLFSTSV